MIENILKFVPMKNMEQQKKKIMCKHGCHYF